MATITMGVTFEGRTAGEALFQSSNATNSVFERLAAAGIAARDLQTRDLSLSPLWDNRSSGTGQRRRIVGYQASNAVVVRVRNLDNLGQILDDVIESGANNFHGLSFGLQNPVPAQDMARKGAVAEAMRKAALYAEAAGLTLRPVVELTESGSSAPGPVMMERMTTMSDAVPVAQGEISVRAAVTIVFVIGAP